MASSDDVYYDTMDSLTDQYATGDLFLTIAQGAYSLTEIEDIDPLEIGTLLGNFGGFWGKFLYIICLKKVLTGLSCSRNHNVPSLPCNK